MKTLLILLILFPALSQADWSKGDTNRQLAFTLPAFVIPLA